MMSLACSSSISLTKNLSNGISLLSFNLKIIDYSGKQSGHSNFTTCHRIPEVIQLSGVLSQSMILERQCPFKIKLHVSLTQWSIFISGSRSLELQNFETDKPIFFNGSLTVSRNSYESYYPRLPDPSMAQYWEFIHKINFLTSTYLHLGTFFGDGAQN